MFFTMYRVWKWQRYSFKRMKRYLGKGYLKNFVQILMKPIVEYKTDKFNNNSVHRETSEALHFPAMLRNSKSLPWLIMNINGD